MRRRGRKNDGSAAMNLWATGFSEKRCDPHFSDATRASSLSASSGGHAPIKDYATRIRHREQVAVPCWFRSATRNGAVRAMIVNELLKVSEEGDHTAISSGLVWRESM